VNGFRTLRLELGSLVTEEAVLWKFISGLRYELKREVLRERSLQVLGDAILAAERANAMEQFARGSHRVVPKKPRDTTVPMDLGNVRAQRQQQDNRASRGRHVARGHSTTPSNSLGRSMVRQG
jgi:hypothetical protein